MPWKLHAASWVQDLIHWASQWIIYCPMLTVATARNGHEKEQAQDRILTKFLFSLMIQVGTGVVSVSAGSYITLQIIGYRMQLAEEAIKTQAGIQRTQAEATTALQREFAERQGKTETELSIIKERHRIEEMISRSQPQKGPNGRNF